MSLFDTPSIGAGARCEYCAKHGLKPSERCAELGAGYCPSCGTRVGPVARPSQRERPLAHLKHTPTAAPASRVLLDAAAARVLCFEDPLRARRPPETVNAKVAQLWRATLHGQCWVWEFPVRLVAFDARDGEVVGAAYVNPHSGYISAVGVASAHRGRGVGKLLVVASVEQIELHARAQPQRAPRSPGSARGAVQPNIFINDDDLRCTPYLPHVYTSLGFVSMASKNAGRGGGKYTMDAIPPDYIESHFPPTGE